MYFIIKQAKNMEFTHFYKDCIIRYDTTFFEIYSHKTRELLFEKKTKCSLSESKYRAIKYVDNIIKTAVIQKISVKWRQNFKEILNNKVNILWQKVT